MIFHMPQNAGNKISFLIHRCGILAAYLLDCTFQNSAFVEILFRKTVFAKRVAFYLQGFRVFVDLLLQINALCAWNDG